jgi:hypothetical protein
MRLRVEESSLQAEPVLATAVTRLRWAGSHLAFSVLGPTVALAAAGLAAELAHGPNTGHELPRVLSAAIVQLPAVAAGRDRGRAVRPAAPPRPRRLGSARGLPAVPPGRRLRATAPVAPGHLTVHPHPQRRPVPCPPHPWSGSSPPRWRSPPPGWSDYVTATSPLPDRSSRCVTHGRVRRGRGRDPRLDERPALAGGLASAAGPATRQAARRGGLPRGRPGRPGQPRRPSLGPARPAARDRRVASRRAAPRGRRGGPRRGGELPAARVQPGRLRARARARAGLVRSPWHADE